MPMCRGRAVGERDAGADVACAVGVVGFAEMVIPRREGGAKPHDASPRSHAAMRRCLARCGRRLAHSGGMTPSPTTTSTPSAARAAAARAQPAAGPESLGEILDRFDKLAHQGTRVAVADLVDAVGTRSYGPFLVVPALIELSPVGGVPGVPTALAAVVVLFAAQMLFGRRRLWMPEWVARRSLGAQRLARLVEAVRPMAQRMDRWFHGRLRALTSGVGLRVAALACIALALMVPPLELFPFASSAPMGAIALIGLALLVRDGVLMIAASLLAGTAVWMVVSLVL